MSNSSLVSYTKLSPNCSSRDRHKILKITPHHMAGNLTIETCGNVFQPTSRQASSTYGIGSDGRIGQYVDEGMRPWTSGSYENDVQAVTIEVANDGGAPDYHVSDKAIESLIKLMVDICKRNGIKEMNYTGDASGNLTRHDMFQNTTCPGPYLGSKFTYIAEQVNKALGNASTNESAVTPPASGGSTTKKLHIYKINEVKQVNGIWQLRSDYLAPTDFTWIDNGIPLDDIDFTDANGNKLSNQVWNGTQKYFTFRVGSLTAKTGLTKGSGGYYWVKFDCGGR